MSDTTRSAGKTKLSEAEFLRLEGEKAKAEIVSSLERAKAALTNNVDPRELTRRHPWIAIGSAAVAGFVAAAVAVPSKEEQELRRLERMQRAMNPPPPAPPSTAAAETNGNAKPETGHSIGATILHELIQLVRPILLTAITASVEGVVHRTPPPTAPPTGSQGPDKSA